MGRDLTNLGNARGGVWHISKKASNVGAVRFAKKRGCSEIGTKTTRVRFEMKATGGCRLRFSRRS